MSAHGGSRSGQAAWGDSREQSSPGPAQEQHVPVRGFNAAEAKMALKRATDIVPAIQLQEVNYPFQTPDDRIRDANRAANSTPEQKPFFYRPGGKDANNRAGGPWGSKPNNMANGKDFFLELRKQVTALRQGGNVAGG
ncbi:conserved hypothetical protein [Aspergillus terreus NIH2624]|uniref:Uncharacterized protein n=1 Tax=Aspergillus terreus (strain NIH 2624 / FGSC A1156) TaxID=341663 RepID=Q0CIN5_ASPTN|nr:uncharacterized protein ATEG_06449 [Aspergillus terreus NIH2624]EAU32993.1 conserved hypothetical protein [Aspergillus terreus NIH2624]